MFSRLSVAITLTLALISQVHGHAVVSPALGIDGEPVRRDAQRPSRGDSRCGRVDVAQNIDTSGTVTPAADGTMTLKVQNFNRATDGSRQMSVTLDATGTGTNFNTPVTVLQNGEARPREARGSDTLILQMPQGVTCTGGASGNKCLMSFESLGGFGNCVVVEQQAGAATGAANTGAANTGTATNTGATGNTGATNTGATANTGANTGATGADNTGVTGTGATGTGATGTGAQTGTGAINNGGDNTALPNTGAQTQTGTGAVNDGDNTALPNTGAVSDGDNTAIPNTGAQTGTGVTGNTGATTGNTGVAGTTSTGTTAGSVGNGAVGSTGTTAGTTGGVVRRNIGGTRVARAVRHGIIA